MFIMNKGLTVNQLMALCKEQIELGNGDKYILISDDDEGNGYHTLFYPFVTDPYMIHQAIELEHDNHNENEVVILG